jgi:hypothetical protein
LASVLLWGAVALYGVLAVWSPWPTTWWAHHVRWVTLGSQLIVLVPCILGLGLALFALYKQHAVLSAAVSMGIAFVVAFASSVTDPESLGSGWAFFAPYFIGPPFMVYILGRLRSNNR